MRKPALLFTRELPGGGYVAIEAERSENATYRARLSVERRSDPTRRNGHYPPVIAESMGATAARVFDELYRIAADNVEIAKGLLRWQSQRLAQH
jgi:hypothetical protein